MAPSLKKVANEGNDEKPDPTAVSVASGARIVRVITAKPFDPTTDQAPGSFFRARDGHMIYWNVWRNESVRPRAVVLAVHGLGEHIHRYEAIFNAFKDAGIVVKGLDTRGHGRTVHRNSDPNTGPAFGYTPLQKVLDDMLTMEKFELDGCKGLPQFVFGHSLGGLYALALVNYRHKEIANFRGVIAQSPALLPAEPTPPIVKLIVSVMKYLGMGRSGKKGGPEYLDMISTDEEIIANNASDPLNHQWMTFRLAHDLNKFGSKLLSRRVAARFTHPLLIYFSPNDQLTNFSAGKRFFENAGSADKTFKAFPGAKHELHNEPLIKAQIIQDYINWILARAN